MKKSNVGVLLILLAVGVLFFLERDPAPVRDPVKDPPPPEPSPVPGTTTQQIAVGEPMPDVIQVKPTKQIFDTAVEGDGLPVPKQAAIVSTLDGNLWAPSVVAVASRQSIGMN